LGGGERVGDRFEACGGVCALEAEAGEDAEDVLGGGSSGSLLGKEGVDGSGRGDGAARFGLDESVDEARQAMRDEEFFPHLMTLLAG
jgi:hypothetical protein